MQIPACLFSRLSAALSNQDTAQRARGTAAVRPKLLTGEKRALRRSPTVQLMNSEKLSISESAAAQPQAEQLCLRTLSRVLRTLLQQRHLVRNVGVKNKNSRHPSGQHAAPSSTAAKFTSQTQRNPPPSTSRSKETHRTAELHQTAAAKSYPG
ncbi:hypothetical protein AOLI_G00091420 [Acnodon oligacanthus]